MTKKYSRISLSTFIASLACLSCAWAQSTAVSVSIDPANAGDPIAPEIYGQFAEHLGRGIYEGVWVGEKSKIPNTHGYRDDVLAALKDLEIPVLRWPGGCFADEYHWRDGVGPQKDRPTRINTHWGWVEEDNSFGTHEFLNFAELIGAEAYVAGNMGSGSPQEMAQWVEYMTSDLDTTLTRERKRNGREKPWKVKYFGVGNESWGCGGNMTPEYSADLHNRYATFVKVKWGDKIVKVATGANVDDYHFTEVLMQKLRPWTADAISMHYYTFPGSWEHKGAATGFPVEEWASTLAHARHMSELIDKHTDIMDKYDPDKRMALFVDEWGTWYDSEPGSRPGFLYQQNSIRDALVAGITLDIFHRNTDRVKMANIAQMVNVLQASILTKGDKMILTPTYHVLHMYKPFKGATPLAAKVSGPDFTIGDFTLPDVDVSAAKTADGSIVLALLNLNPEKSVTIDTNLSGTAAGSILTGDTIDAHNTFDAPDTVSPTPYEGALKDGKLSFAMPPRSIAVVMVK